MADRSKSSAPNIIFILADDLGYADLSCFGRDDYETPQIDRLAREGLRFKQSYANSSVCSPTRLALITGRYQYRLPAGLDEPLGPNPELGLPPDHPTIASLLRDLGYDTSLVGKWHLGYLPKFGPLKSGYNRFYGAYGGGLDYFTHAFTIGDFSMKDLFEDETAIEEHGYLTDMFTDRAVAEIDRLSKGDKPFFLSVHYTAPHWPWEGPGDAEVAKTLRNPFHYDGGSNKIYAEMVASLDRGVGRALDALDASGKAENTIVVFTSDNGGERFSKNWPFTGVKGELLEGGVRVPTLARWPARVKAGAVSEQVQMSMDWLPTLLAAAGGAPHPDYPSDGENLLDAMTGGPLVENRRLFWRHKSHDQIAVRAGDMKYLSLGGFEYLFNLADDPMERANLKKHQPALFNELKAAFAAWDKDMLPYAETTFSYDFKGKGTVADRY